MTLSFELSMPSVNSWNGKWTGEGALYAKVVNVGKSKKVLEKYQGIVKKRYYTYAFGDGWVAAVTVREVDSIEARKIRKKSQGFQGYDWMVYSIIDHGRIQVEE